MVLAVGLQPQAHGAAKAAFLVFFAATIVFGGLVTGQWMMMDPDPGTFHPGYHDPVHEWRVWQLTRLGIP
jgi:tellurite resistance protein